MRYETDGIRNAVSFIQVFMVLKRPETGRYAQAGAVTLTINDIRAQKDLKQYARHLCWAVKM